MEYVKEWTKDFDPTSISGILIMMFVGFFTSMCYAKLLTPWVMEASAIDKRAMETRRKMRIEKDKKEREKEKEKEKYKMGY